MFLCYFLADLMNVSGLAKEWDESEGVRSRLGDWGIFCTPAVVHGDDIKTVASNYGPGLTDGSEDVTSN